MSKFTKARKEHTCSLCFTEIPKGEHYIYQTVTPWEHIENEVFGVYKAHIECDEAWENVGSDCYWILPENKFDWADIIEDNSNE